MIMARPGLTYRAVALLRLLASVDFEFPKREGDGGHPPS
jgi:hypothetical protein